MNFEPVPQHDRDKNVTIIFTKGTPCEMQGLMSVGAIATKTEPEGTILEVQLLIKQRKVLR